MRDRERHVALKMALSRAVELGMLQRNPAQLTSPPRPSRPEMRVLSEDEAQKLLAALVGTSADLPAFLALTTGARLGEILALRWSDIDLDDGVAQIRRTVVEHMVGQGHCSWFTFKEPKSGHGRSVDLGDATIARLRAHRKSQAEIRLAAGSAWAELDLVICTPTGMPERPSTTSGRFRTVVGEAGLRGVRFHDLRQHMRPCCQRPAHRHTSSHSASDTRPWPSRCRSMPMCSPDSRDRPLMPSKPPCFPTPRTSRVSRGTQDLDTPTADRASAPRPTCRIRAGLARARARLCCINSVQTARTSPQTFRRGHVSGLEGTFRAHPCPLKHSRPFVAMREDAGRPACVADGSTVDRGAPKGIRNLTCGFQRGSGGPAGCRIVAGHSACATSVGSIAFQPDSGCFAASSVRKARGWHADASGARDSTRQDPIKARRGLVFARSAGAATSFPRP